MGGLRNIVNGQGLKVNTDKHISMTGEDGTHPPLSHYCAELGKLAFSYTCTVRAPLGVSMALDRACIV